MGHVGMDDRSLAGRVLQLLDLTSLGDGDDESVVERLCRRATTAHGDVAAVCVWPRFVAQCRRQLPGSRVRIASVANFPDGGEDIAKAVLMLANGTLAYSTGQIIKIDGGMLIDRL